MGIYESARCRHAVRLPLKVQDNPLITMLEEGVL